MQDGDGRLLYVGKAKNLKKRLASYFRKTGLAPKTAALVARFDEACVALVAGDLGAWVDELAAVEFYGQSLAEYREGMTPGAGTCGG